MPDDPTTSAKLPRGSSALDRAAVGAVHRERLERAALEEVARTGYAATTVADIARRAHVSTNAFYVQYRAKDDCFLAAWDAGFAQLAEQLRRAASAPPQADDLRAGLNRVISRFVDAAAADPDRARALLTGVLAVGPEGPERRRRIVDELQRNLLAAQAPIGGPPAVPEIALAVVAGGVVRVVEQRLRSRRPRWPRTLAADLTTWAMSYESHQPLPVPDPGLHPHLQEVPPQSAELVRLPRGPHRLPRAFVAQHQRRRILHAVTELARAEGYSGVTVPAIAARAHISNRTVYEHFADKEQAFLAAYDTAFNQVFARAFYAAAGQEEWVAAVREGVRAWLDHLAGEPDLARFGLSDVHTAAEAAPRVEEAYVAFAQLLASGAQHARSGRDVPEIVPYALAAGVASLLGAWVVDERAEELPVLAPLICYLTFAPFVGNAAAHRVAA